MTDTPKSGVPVGPWPAAFLLVALACGDTSAPGASEAPVASVAVTPAQHRLVVGESHLFTATPRDAAGRSLISATSAGRTAGADVTVGPAPLARVALDPATLTLVRGETRAITAIPYDAAGNILTRRAVVWYLAGLPGVREVHELHEGRAHLCLAGSASAASRAQGVQPRGRAVHLTCPDPRRGFCGCHAPTLALGA